MNIKYINEGERDSYIDWGTKSTQQKMKTWLRMSQHSGLEKTPESKSKAQPFGFDEQKRALNMSEYKEAVKNKDEFYDENFAKNILT